MPFFRVDETFAIEQRSLFVLAGEITEGTIQAGMVVHVPFNDAVSMTAPVHGIENLVRGGQSRVAMTIRYDDDVELMMWRGMNIGDGEILLVSEAAADGGIQEPRRRPWWKWWRRR